MYKISEFAKMTGLSQSKIRFYEKNGLLQVKKNENGYRYFDRFDAFRVNTFRTLLRYGFTVQEAISMLEERQSGKLFIKTLKDKKEELQKQIEIMDGRLNKIDTVISFLKDDYENKFEIINIEDYFYVLVSDGIDFSLSYKNWKTVAQFGELLSITSYARIISSGEILNKKNVINPSYAYAIPLSKEIYLGDYDKSKVKQLKLGKCIRYLRRVNREKSETLESFDKLLSFINENNYEVCGNILLLPTFLNLDNNERDIEVLYIPIK